MVRHTVVAVHTVVLLPLYLIFYDLFTDYRNFLVLQSASLLFPQDCHPPPSR